MSGSSKGNATDTARRTKLEQQRRQKQGRSLALTLGAAALLVGGGTIAYFLLNQGASDTVIPVGATVIPQSALMSITVDTDKAPWQQLKTFGTPTTQTQWANRLKTVEADFLTPFGLTFDQNIRPWVGTQMNLALLSPSPEDVATVGAQAAVWFLPMKEAPQARALLSRVMGSTAQKRVYKDIEVQTVQGQNNKPLSVLVLEGRLMVVSNGNTTLNQVIDTYRGSPSLSQLPRLPEALKAVDDPGAFAQVYLNLPLVTAGLLQSSGRNLSQSTLQHMQSVQGLGSTVRLENDGLSFKAITWLKPDAKQVSKLNNKSQTLAQQLPADTLLMISGGDLQQAWQDYAQGTEAQLILPLKPTQLQSGLLKATGVDFEKDFLPWMNGEFVTAVVPTASPSKKGVGLMVLAKASDRTKITQSFQRLDAAMRDRNRFLVAESKVGNRAVTAWKVPPNLPLATHGWLDNNVAFFTFGAPITDRILKPQSDTLAGSALFKKTRSAQLGNNAGQFFIDLPRTVTTLQNSPLLPKLAPSVLNVAEAIEGIGVTTAVNNNWSTRYDFIVKLKR